jgi:hypothetical protein
MTLIISLLTPTYVAQVSDLRLTERPAGTPLTEPAAKAVSWCGHTNFGYTGPAVLDGKRTDQWIAEILVNYRKVQEGLAELRARASVAASRLPAENRHLAIVGVGWSLMSTQSRLRPTLFEITNVPAGDWPNAPLPDCALRIEQLAGNQRLAFHGQPVPAADRRYLRRRVERLAGARTAPGPVLTHMIQVAQSVAESNAAVSEQLLLSYLPRDSVGRTDLMMPLVAPTWDQAKYVYLPARGDPPVMYGPTIVCAGSITMGISIATGGDTAPSQWLPDQITKASK